MPGKQQWDEEDESSSGYESSEAAPAPAPLMRRANKFEDEEDNDSDVLDSWDAEDSEVEREKAKKEAEAQAKAAAAAAEAAANKKSKTQRIADRLAERAPALKASAVVLDERDPTKTVDLGALPLLNPTTKPQFDKLLQTLGPILAANAKKPHYVLFAQELVKELCRDLPSDQIKKITSTLSALGNDKLREEKAADKGGKKSKAAKTKTTLAVGRPNVVDTGVYNDDDAYGDDDFM
ncbi:eukaryotic translation initiation factor 3 subunit [Niveomyces insectorum RCEF 264]|uniref:Eukaryotic translation initiation factor 3 subunit J n=1 Tax=Niveomyces insectorum RCEF 264 TaxID=1081102 RepID=A0A167REL5_9HYPO|nr:eukaryotic translation initiation factor 3 subunit [Niveomyces insectorum RCEF 264]